MLYMWTDNTKGVITVVDADTDNINEYNMVPVIVVSKTGDLYNEYWDIGYKNYIPKQYFDTTPITERWLGMSPTWFLISDPNSILMEMIK